jgi:hypothetical protein
MNFKEIIWGVALFSQLTFWNPIDTNVDENKTKIVEIFDDEKSEIPLENNFDKIISLYIEKWWKLWKEEMIKTLKRRND